MTYDEKIKWLRRYRASLEEEQILALELEQVKTEAAHITPLFSDAPGGQGGQDKLPKAVERILETQQHLQAQINHTHAVRAEIATAINAVPNADGRKILRRKYLLGQHWETIACNIYKSYRATTRLHRKTVEKMEI